MKKLILECVRKTEGFTLGKHYKLLGCAGEYVQLKDDNKKECILFESYFDIVNKSFK